MSQTYTVTIHPADEGGFWATCTEVPGANGQGETEEEAKQNLRDSIHAIVEDQIIDQATTEAAWFHEAARRGVTTKEALVSWADSKIMRLDSPPLWLIELSTLKSRSLLDHASIIEPHLAGKLPVECKVSLVAEAHSQGALDLNNALGLIFKIWIPVPHSMDDRVADSAGSPFDWQSLSDLLVEWDVRHVDQDFPDDFASRCSAALSDHLARYDRPPSSLFLPPSPI